MTSNLCINRLILALTLCGGLPFTSKAELNYSDKAIVQQSTIKVKGIVVDEQGESIIGATVIQQGTKNGTITDLDGKFVLDVPEGSHPGSVFYRLYQQYCECKAIDDNYTSQQHFRLK